MSHQYTLKQGIADGFLAPYRVHRVITSHDAAGWRPGVGDPIAMDGRSQIASTPPRILSEASLKKRSETIARHLAEFKRAHRSLCQDDCVLRRSRTCRRDAGPAGQPEPRPGPAAPRPRLPRHIRGGDVGRGFLESVPRARARHAGHSHHLAASGRLERRSDGQECCSDSSSPLDQRVRPADHWPGTRVRDEFGKLFFNIIDYTGSATTNFADPDFDDRPIARK